MTKDFYKNYEIMEEAEVQRLLSLAQKGDITARDKIVEGHLKFIGYINNRMQNTEDGFQAGCLGLLHAIKKYDLSRIGVKFSYYAAYWIKQRIGREIDKEKYQTSYNLIENSKKYSKLLNENQQLADCEIIEKLKIKENTLQTLKDMRERKISFQNTINELSLEDMIGTTETVENIENMIKREYLIKLIESECTIKEGAVIKDIFFNGYTENELAKKLKVTKMAVNQLKNRGLLKLRRGIYEAEYI